MKCQLARYVTVARRSPRSEARSENVLVNQPTTATTTNISANAGRSRRARRAQKAGREMRPVRPTSAISRVVMRKPEMTKKMSTPRYPDRNGRSPRWNNTTRRTAIPRKPSSGRTYPNEGAAWVRFVSRRIDAPRGYPLAASGACAVLCRSRPAISAERLPSAEESEVAGDDDEHGDHQRCDDPSQAETSPVGPERSHL